MSRKRRQPAKASLSVGGLEELESHHLQIFEEVLEKLTLTALMNKMMPLDEPYESQFREQLKEFFSGDEGCPLTNRILASVDYDLGRLDMEKLKVQFRSALEKPGDVL